LGPRVRLEGHPDLLHIDLVDRLFAVLSAQMKRPLLKETNIS
jgi:hypothetical protein